MLPYILYYTCIIIIFKCFSNTHIAKYLYTEVSFHILPTTTQHPQLSVDVILAVHSIFFQLIVLMHVYGKYERPYGPIKVAALR